MKEEGKINRIKEVVSKRKDTEGNTRQWLSHEAKLTYAAIHAYWEGNREPRLETLRQIAKALKCSIKDLVNDK